MSDEAFFPTELTAPKTYISRWWICATFSLLCVLQNSIWNFNAPINGPLEDVYGWSDDYITWLGNTANMTFCILVVPMGMFIARFGTRWGFLISVFTLWVNAGLRCLPDRDPAVYDPAAMIAMVFNGISGTTETLSPPVLSSLWFPVHERVVATAIMASANAMGAGVGFAMAFLVPPNATTASQEDEVLGSLHMVYWIYFVATTLLLLAGLCYFPKAPPSPPSASSSVAHNLSTKTILTGLKQLLTHGRFWVVCAAFAVPSGVYDGWINILDINLKNLDNFDQSHAGWIGFGSVVGGAVAGVISGRIADVFPGSLRQIVMVMYTCAGLCFIWFTLTCWKVLPFSLASVYISTCAAGFFMYGTSGLFYELVMEVTFPISDACVASVLALAQALFSSVYLTIPVGAVGTAWMNPALCACPLATVVVLFFFPDDYARLKLDENPEKGSMQYVVAAG